jgi:hypothetical protein
MSKVKDLTNQVFNRLTALRSVGRDNRNKAVWLCRCSCDGKEIEVMSSNLVSGNTASCGCIHDEMAAARLAVMRPTQLGENNPNFKHGHTMQSGDSPIYSSWRGMVNRCTNPTHARWMNYGGAGITVCERWLNSFEAFLEDMGERPAGTTLGRFGDIGNYCKENCAWQTDREQKAEQKIKRTLKFLAVA